MYLTKIDIDFRRAAAREALLDAQVMHKALTALFGTSRKDGDILYRLNHGVQSASVYVYSNIPAAEGFLPPLREKGCQALGRLC